MAGGTAQRFLSERQAKKCPLRFDRVAIDERPGRMLEIRLYKKAFSPFDVGK
jgi:hypothetical protein